MKRRLAVAMLALAAGGPALAAPTILTASLPTGAFQQSYYTQLTATDPNVLNPTFIWSLTNGLLPAGLNFLNSNNFGVITGTPTVAGTFYLTFTVQENSGNTFIGSAFQSYTLTITAGPPSITLNTLPPAVQGTQYSATLTASGGVPPYQWTFVSFDTQGLSIGFTTGTITGVPPTPGIFFLTVQLTDSVGASARQTLQLFVATPLRVLTTSLPNGSSGTFYSQALSPGGGQPPYTWSLLTGILPPGLQLSPTGVISGTPSGNGTYPFTVQLLDFGKRVAQANLVITIGPGLTITTSSLPDGTVGQPYSQTIAASGGLSPYVWSIVSGSLPSGLALDSGSGTVSGTPNTVSTLTVTVQVTDSLGGSAQANIAINIRSSLTIVTSALPDAAVGSAYSQTLASSGGLAPLLWSISQGALPAGLTLNVTTGAIAGTPSFAGASSFTVTVTDASRQTASKALAILVASPLTITTGDFTATAGVAFSLTLAASGGTPPYVWGISSGSLPAGLRFDPGSALISGTPTAPGSSTITVAIIDARQQVASKTITVTVNPPLPPALTITAGTGAQPPVSIALASAYFGDVSGTLTLSFNSSVGGDDQMLAFAAGGGRTATFTIRASTTQAVFANGATSAPLLMPTVAGTITLTVTSLRTGNTDIMPATPPSRTITIDPAAPVITGVAFQQQPGGFTVTVTGYSNTREMASAQFHFVPASNNSFATSDFTVQLGPAFSTYYQSSASFAFGSLFTLTMPFTVQGNAQAVVSYTVTLTNTKGTTPPTQGNP